MSSEQAPNMSAELKAIVEALIFASPEPITPKMLFRLLADEPKEDVLAAVEALKADYEARPGLQFVEVAGGYQIVTRPELHEWVRRLFHERSTQKLTVQALETLAVIAYKQPITAAEITEIRGVDSDSAVRSLERMGLIEEAARAAEAQRQGEGGVPLGALLWLGVILFFFVLPMLGRVRGRRYRGRGAAGKAGHHPRLHRGRQPGRLTGHGHPRADRHTRTEGPPARRDVDGYAGRAHRRQ